MASLASGSAGDAGGSGSSRPPQGAPPPAPVSSADRSHGRNSQSLDACPSSPPQLVSPSTSDNVYELRQMVASLQSQNSQLQHTAKEQQVTIAQLEVCSVVWLGR